MAIQIDNDNNEIRIDGYEYANSKVSVKTYGVSSQDSQTVNSADLRLTGSDSSIDNVTFTGGANVTVVSTDANKITISASANDTNTTYGVSAETSQTGNSADLRLTGSDSSTDNVTVTGGTAITVVRTDANKITISNGGVTQAVAGTGISVSAGTGSVTVGNTGVTSINGAGGAQFVYNTITDGANPTSPSNGNTTLTLSGSNGIKIATSSNTATVSMSQTTITKPSDSNINGGSTLNILSTGVIPTNNTIEVSGVILFAFLPGGATNTFDIILSTGSGAIGNNTSKVAVGFTCHAGPTAGSPGEAIKNVTAFTYPQSIANTNNHVIRFSGLFQTDGTTPNSLIINMKNNNAGPTEYLVVYAKSFIRYNVI
jgi:hypothetical protein